MPRRARPFWSVCALALVWLGLWGITAATIFQYSGWTRDFGYTLARERGALRVFTVSPGGPADGKLKPGDRIVAIDGDRRASSGGVLRVLDLPRDAAYSVRVSRGGREIDYRLRLPLRRYEVPWWGIVSCLVSALAGIAIGTLLGLMKPESRTVRYAAAFLFLSACMSLSVAVNEAVLRGWRLVLLGALGILGNLNGPIGYQCASAFPVAVKEGRGWKTIKGLVWAAGLFFWLLLLPSELTWLLGTDRGVSFYARFYPLADAAAAWWIRLFPLRGILLCLAVSAVLVRNYRQLGSAGERRRIRLVVVGVLAALAPQLVLQAGFAAYKLTGRGIDPNGSTASEFDLALGPLVTLVLAPLLAYAILKHRVLGIEIVIRKGLHYLLAKQALQALLVLPAAVFVARIVARPHLTVSEALFGNWWCGVLIVASGVALRFRRPLVAALDGRFFREAYDREQILKEVMEQIQAGGWSPEMEKSVCGRMEAALHPQSVALLRHDPAGEATVVAYASPPVESIPVPTDRALIERLGNRSNPQQISNLQEADRDRLRSAGVELAVPVRGIGIGSLGVLFLGAKRSEEPYDATDRALLEAIAGQLGIVYENYCLRESVDREKQTRLQVLAHVSEAGINLLRECPECGACSAGPS